MTETNLLLSLSTDDASNDESEAESSHGSDSESEPDFDNVDDDSDDDIANDDDGNAEVDNTGCNGDDAQIDNDDDDDVIDDADEIAPNSIPAETLAPLAQDPPDPLPSIHPTDHQSDVALQPNNSGPATPIDEPMPTSDSGEIASSHPVDLAISAMGPTTTTTPPVPQVPLTTTGQHVLGLELVEQIRLTISITESAPAFVEAMSSSRGRVRRARQRDDSCICGVSVDPEAIATADVLECRVAGCETHYVSSMIAQ